jgi:hypothetical protein
MALHRWCRQQQQWRPSARALLFVCCLGPAAAVPLAGTTLPLSQIVWQPEKNLQFLGSPAIALLANGSYLASHDDYGPKSVSSVVRWGTPALAIMHTLVMHV